MAVVLLHVTTVRLGFFFLCLLLILPSALLYFQMNLPGENVIVIRMPLIFNDIEIVFFAGHQATMPPQ